ncbi:MAG TPA: DUF1684 domain-containing protein [Actinomycetota bacterium]|nr:DUF1684 domain-containing protein [Actinomycetota bacterium]
MGTDSLSLLDWRRRVAALYAAVRACDDPRAAHARWCATRAELLATHPQSPVPVAQRPSYAGPPVAPYDPAFRFEVELDAAVEPVHLDIPTGTDGVVPYDRVGRLHLPGVGDLDAWWLASYGGGVFVPIRDGLAGDQTYGGGRYVLDTVKGADLGGSGGRLVIDLNFAYNPSCAYDPAWACPLAQPGNVVRAPVYAGELYRS